MKKKICSLSVLFLMCNGFANSQSGWYQQESGTLNALQSVYFINSNTGWVSGNDGTILKTTNSGINWVPQTSNTNVHLLVVYFLNENTGFSSGYKVRQVPPYGVDCLIIKTTDGGIIWDTLIASGDYYIANINFINSVTGYFAGGLYTSGPNKILKTTDAGNTFEEQNSTTSGVLYSIKFANSNLGYSCGIFNNIIKTTNGGAQWSEQSSLSVDMLNSLTFLDENTGFVVGGNLYGQGFGNSSSYIGKTTNGGLNWVTQLDDTAGYFLSQVFFVNQQTGYVCGSPDFTDPSGCSHNKFYKTTDSGNEWNELSTPIFESLTSIYFNDANTGFAVGCSGKILKTLTGGTVGINLLSSEIPSGYNLEQNHPNPFNPATVIRYSIPSNVNGQTSDVRLTIYNSIGKEISTLVNERQNAGSYSVTFDGSNFSSGIYFYKLETGSFTDTKRMVLLK